MEVRSIYKYARISPKKARDVAREIRGLPVSDSIDALNFTPKKAAFLIGKTLKSAVANAENNHDLAADSLHVKEANISDGPSFRRFKPRARGSASAIKKRTSHIYIILTDEGHEEAGAPRREKRIPEAPVAEAEEVEEEPAAEDEAPEAAESDEGSSDVTPVATDQTDEGSEDPAVEDSEQSPDEESEGEDAAESASDSEEDPEDEQKD